MNDVYCRIPGFCTQCRSRCGCDAIVENGKILRIEPKPSHPSGERLCPKGKAAAELVYHPDRLTAPMKRTSPKGARHTTWEPMQWEDALAEIAGQMQRIRKDHGAEQVAFSVTTPSGTHISDGISWIERFVRAFGSPNSIYGTEICNWHKDIASKFTYGTDIGTPDFANTQCVLLWGHNPTTTWLARSGEVLKALKKGAKMVVVDPRPTPFAKRADCWLKVRPGTDQALALGIAHLLLSQGGFDVEFVREWTNAAFLVREDTAQFLRQSDLDEGGSSDIVFAQSRTGSDLLRFDTKSGQWLDSCADAEMLGQVSINNNSRSLVCQSALKLFASAASDYSPARVAQITGVDEKELEHAARILADSASTAYYAWNGVGQSTTATQTDRAISILYGLTGHYGKRGGNIAGSVVPFNDIAGHDLLTDEQRKKALGFDARPLGPGNHSWVTARDVYRAAIEQDPYPVKMLFSFGGNLLASQPDAARARQAFEQLEFHVHTDFFMNASAEYADIVLPVATSWEREGLRNGFDVSLQGMRHVQLRSAVIEPVGEAKSDTDIVLELSARLGLSDAMFDCNVDKGHAHLLAPAGVDIDTLRGSPEGVTLADELQPFAYGQQGFKTPTTRLEIYSESLQHYGYDPIPVLHAADLPNRTDENYPLILSGAKTIAYCHSQGRNIPSLRRLTPDPILEISHEDAAHRDISDNDWLEISTQAGVFFARAKRMKGLAPGSVFAQHGWTVSDRSDAPNTDGDRLATNMNNAISTDRSDPVSGSIPLRCSGCEIRKVEANAEAKSSRL